MFASGSSGKALVPTTPALRITGTEEPSTGASATNPFDVEEGSRDTPIDLTPGARENPLMITEEEDHGEPIADPNKGICVGILKHNSNTVWARLCGTRQVLGYRIEKENQYGDPVPWPASYTVVTFENIDFLPPYRDLSKANARGVFRALLQVG